MTHSFDTTNLVLTLTSDSLSYPARLRLAEVFLQTGDRAKAVAGMSTVLKDVMRKSPRLFDAWERAPDVLAAAVDEALDSIVEDIAPIPTTQATHTDNATNTTTSKFSAQTLAPLAPLAPSSVDPLPERHVESDVLAVLRKCRVEECLVFLPDEKLDRKLYERTNEVLLAMGGKWKGGAVKGHIFADAEPAAFAQCFNELKATGTYTHPKDLGFFETQPELAAQVIELAGIWPGQRVLEPSAGRAALARLAADIVGVENVQCVELFPPNARELENAGFTVLQQDFLTLEPPTREENKFDVVVMNPPFGKMQDAAHVRHACNFLKSTGRLVAITSPSWETHSTSNHAESFRELMQASKAQIITVPAGAFKAAGTMVATRIVAIDGENLPWNRQALDESDESYFEEEAQAECPAP